MHTRSTYTILVFLLLWNLPATAQDQRADEDHPITCRHDAFDALAFLAGDWDVASRYRNADGEWEETTALATITYDMDGCLLMERLRGTRNGAAFSARAIMAYNSISKRLQRAWTDSGHGLLVLYTGETTPEGIALQNEMSIRGRTVLFRHVYTDIDDDTFRLESRRSNDQGKTWDTGWFLTYRRNE